MAESRHPERWLLFATLAMIASFVAASGYATYRAETIDSAADDISNNAAPSIQHLATARSEVRHLEALMLELPHLSPAAQARQRDEIAAARTLLNDEVQNYLSLSTFPGERAVWSPTERELGELEASTTRALQALDRGQTDKAEGIIFEELQPAADRASAAFLKSLDFNAGWAQGLAERIKATREQASRISLGLHVLCGILSAVAMLLLLSAWRRRQRLEDENQRLLQSRADELEQFSARLAHDVMSPLNAVGLGIDTALRHLPDRPDLQSVLQRSQRNLRRTALIVQGLWEFARSGARPTPHESTELRKVIEELALELKGEAAERGTELLVEPFAPMRVACAPGVVSSVLSNLLRNAIKYIGEGAVRRITVRAERGRGLALVEVEDTGPGLGAGMDEKIFDPYVRGPVTTQPGLGLGLATVKRLVEAHGGEVGVRSAPGKGCTFWFRIPLALDVAEDEPGERPPHPRPERRQLVS